jgi:hypothetical protein
MFFFRIPICEECYKFQNSAINRELMVLFAEYRIVFFCVVVIMGRFLSLTLLYVRKLFGTYRS